MIPVTGLSLLALLTCSKIIPKKIPNTLQTVKPETNTKKCVSFISDATMDDPKAYDAKALWARTAMVLDRISAWLLPMPMANPSKME